MSPGLQESAIELSYNLQCSQAASRLGRINPLSAHELRRENCDEARIIKALLELIRPRIRNRPSELPIWMRVAQVGYERLLVPTAQVGIKRRQPQPLHST